MGEFVKGAAGALIVVELVFVRERVSGVAAIALSRFCEPPGADARDLVNNSWVVGGTNGMGRGAGGGTDDAGGGSVASGTFT